ncbi:UbiA family prenyltransferase [Ochrovirga pacifica]|uniref:UbiA family prenyltransferase n=1 Tax=Ochrovirga pacifica TaxID=1042376 RepID=UPI0002557F60|nr:UbiA family prenyltransferase [Ochrovirga pacifica]
MAAINKHKFVGLFSVVRGNNIILLTIAQYLSAIFVFDVGESLYETLVNWHLHFVVLATICVVSAGYIINDFYDAKMDVVNKPIKTQMGNWISQKTKLQVYFAFNFIAFFLGVLISWKAALFFSSYIFLIWLYSHKLQKNPDIRIFFVSILDMFPFFVVFVFYENLSMLILTHGLYLYLVLLLKELIKDFERDKGAIVMNRKTLVLKYGENKVKNSMYLFLIMLGFPTYYLLQLPEVGWMRYYFYAGFVWIPVFCYLLSKATKNKDYFTLHNFIRIVLVVGVFSLSLIDTSVLLIKLLKGVKI